MSADRFGNINRSQRCLSVEAQLFDYVDSALSTPEVQAVDEHLAGCEQCRLEVEHIRCAESALAAARISIPAPGDLYAGFAGKLNVQQSKVPLLRLRHLTSAFALAVIALMLFIPTSLRHTHQTNIVAPAITDSITRSKTSLVLRTDIKKHRVVASNLGERSTVQIRREVLHSPIKTSIRSVKLASEHRSEFAITWGAANRADQRNALPVDVRSSLESFDLADNLRQAHADLAKDSPAQIPQVHTPSVADSNNSSPSRDEFMYYQMDRKQTVALGLESREYSSLFADQETGAGFALVVQDDVRGFTAEAHNTDLSVSPTSRIGGASDDGVKVEVEFDGTAGATSF